MRAAYGSSDFDPRITAARGLAVLIGGLTALVTVAMVDIGNGGSLYSDERASEISRPADRAAALPL